MQTDHHTQKNRLKGIQIKNNYKWLYKKIMKAYSINFSYEQPPPAATKTDKLI